MRELVTSTKEFTAFVYKGHRQVVDKTKWYDKATRVANHEKTLDFGLGLCFHHRASFN